MSSGVHDKERKATAARYSRRISRIEVQFEDGVLFAFLAALAQGLRGAALCELAEVELSPDGLALHSEPLDVDLKISALLAGAFGTRTWMRELRSAR